MVAQNRLVIVARVEHQRGPDLGLIDEIRQLCCAGGNFLHSTDGRQRPRLLGEVAVRQREDAVALVGEQRRIGGPVGLPVSTRSVNENNRIGMFGSRFTRKVIGSVVRGSAVAVRGRTESPVAVAKSVQPLLAVWARVADGAQRRGELSRAAWSFDRAGRMPKSLESPPAGEMARALRASTRQLSRVGVVSGRGMTRDAGLELALAFSELLLEIAAWHEVSKRSHHCAAATRSARCVGRFADESGRGMSGAPRTTAAVVDSVRDRAPSRGRTPRAPASSTPEWLPRRGEERKL